MATSETAKSQASGNAAQWFCLVDFMRHVFAHLRQRLQGRFRPGEKPNFGYRQVTVRAIDGLVAAIGCAAFPNMFHLAADNGELTDAGVNNILRAVRGAYKKSER